MKTSQIFAAGPRQKLPPVSKSSSWIKNIEWAQSKNQYIDSAATRRIQTLSLFLHYTQKIQKENLFQIKKKFLISFFSAIRAVGSINKKFL